MTPFGLRLQLALDLERQRMANEWFFKWHFIGRDGPVEIDSFDGRKIHYGGIKFDGTARAVYWTTLGRYLRIKNGEIFDQLETELKGYPEARVEAAITDTKVLMESFARSITEDAIEKDRILRGNGIDFPPADRAQARHTAIHGEIAQRARALTDLYNSDEDSMLFDRLPKSNFEIVAQDGDVRSCSVQGVFTGEMVVIWDTSIIVQPGDELRRRLPNGTDEAFEVLDPKFFEKLRSVPAHYQIKIRRKGAFPQGSGGNYNINVSGHNPRVNIGSQDNSTNVAFGGDIFSKLTATLEAGVDDSHVKDDLLSALDEMRREQGKAGFAAAYQRFISLAKDHMELIIPFLPALSKLFGV